MADILFTHSYFYKFDDKQWKNQQPYPPYGTLCAAAVLRECGFEVALFDTNLRDSPDEIGPALAAARPRYLVIYDDGFNYLTKMCLTRMREAAFAMAKTGRAAGCTVIVSSSDATDHCAEYLAEGADFIVVGEGEITLRELILALEAGRSDCRGIAGLAFANPATGEVVNTPPRPVLHELDQLPDPAWDLVEMADYQRIWRRHGYFSLNLATTRGCPYKCNWCAKPIYGNRYNSRSPERVVAEIEGLMQRYGATHFWMSDDIFGLKPGWVQRFRELVKARNLRFSYKIQSRVDLLLKEDNIAALAESGLQQAWVGAESGAQKILDAMDKGTTVQEIREATRLLKKHGVEVCFFLQYGYLGETREDIEATLRLVEELLPHDIGVSVSYPLPGTKFYDKVRTLLGVKHNWTDSDDLAMLYPATFPPAFYRRLHRLTHKRFRLRQGLAECRKLLRGKRPDWRRALLTAYYAPAAWVDGLKLNRLERSA
ncbi:MAG: B12-binding domain-containing radical SAM protein [Saprospiraceae bacterium]|nr:B12-binding domain-containing radical SAM protein [Saprospiraceae bacterium]